jgi:hypothetical protein
MEEIDQVPASLSQTEKIDRKGYMNALSYYHTNNTNPRDLFLLKAT